MCLTVPSDEQWAVAAVRSLPALLVDHAHCEMKAATNALSLVGRYPETAGNVLARALADIAAEEVLHFQQVLALLDARGLVLGAPPVDTYAASLRHAAAGLPPHRGASLVDRLLVAALIEARSCERFKLLTAALDQADTELCDFYAGLLASEARHYRTFVDLACEVGRGEPAMDEPTVLSRLARLATMEAKIVSTLAHAHGGDRATIHG